MPVDRRTQWYECPGLLNVQSGLLRNAILRFVLIFNIRAAILPTSNAESLTATQDSKMEILSKIEHCKEALETRHLMAVSR